MIFMVNVKVSMEMVTKWIGKLEEIHLLRKSEHQHEDNLKGKVERKGFPGFSFIIILICRLRNEY